MQQTYYIISMIPMICLIFQCRIRVWKTFYVQFHVPFEAICSPMY